VKLLFDANLARRLVISLDDFYPGSVHVDDLGLAPDDEAIWHYAKANGYTVVSKDTDFYRMSVTWGAPPKVIWMRVGNCSTSVIENALRASFTELSKFENDTVASLLIVNRS
jgi:predicted nuclease of predicted toxin-antitoxin system